MLYKTDLAELKTAARNVIQNCMGAKPGESILIVVDEPSLTIVEPFLSAAKELNLEAAMISFPALIHSGQEPPVTVAAAMLAASIILMPTSCSLSHTMARSAASRAGARIASMPSLTPDMMVRTLNADYRQIAQLSRAVSGAGKTCGHAHLTCPRGSNIQFSYQGRTWFDDTGIYTEPGAFGNLPAGEACVAPLEGTAEGIVIVDGSVAGEDFLGTELTLTVHQGMLANAVGPASESFLATLDAAGTGGRNMAELGIGTNHMARLTGHILENEKILGTVHVAFGNNLAFGGSVSAPIHMDALVLKPSLVLDEKLEILREGDLLIKA